VQHPYDNRHEEEEVGRSLLNPTGPFDDHHNVYGPGGHNFGDDRPQSTYSLTETYASDAPQTRSHTGSDVYSATGGYDPATEFG